LEFKRHRIFHAGIPHHQTPMSLPQFHSVHEHSVRFRRRLLIYFAAWFLAALAFQIFLDPEPPTATGLTPLVVLNSSPETTHP
jgi:hypothetical protein